ncbi:MAG: hypothetical protein ACE5JL_05990 [Dehalococcoidia bacterium]
MTSKNEQNDALLLEFQEREAGVAELLDLYARVEENYFAAIGEADSTQLMATSDSTHI